MSWASTRSQRGARSADDFDPAPHAYDVRAYRRRPRLRGLTLREELVALGVLRPVETLDSYVEPRPGTFRMDRLARRAVRAEVLEQATGEQLVWLAEHGAPWLREACARVTGA